ncbi:SDR family oxidoreductase [Paenisporosarcina sp. OV554]|uniref:SDR family oxidoreductase n=1 Tax=Paenisporosarcina sp. OV554 TaxID=2135694 RepID=UPI001E34D903|nr:SDR family oxidoreductase [Paenisporosarcina sp. OV554]
MDGLVRWLAIELSPMRVNVVSPGIVNTPIYAGMPEDQRRGMFNGIAEQLPVKRIAKPEDIAQSYVYLAKKRIHNWICCRYRWRRTISLIKIVKAFLIRECLFCVNKLSRIKKKLMHLFHLRIIRNV